MAFQLSNTSTYNVENVLRQNIVNSDYYNNTCLALTTWEEVVDEMYETVQHVEPWMSGNARGPSTAFCLLYRLFTLELSVREVRNLLDHKDSPYIRAVGFLYLRYVCDFKKIWQWVADYVKDPQEFAPSPGGKEVTMGEFVRDILLEQYYFETIFPRIPKPVLDAVIDDLKQLNLPTAAKGNGGAGGPDRRGVDDGNKRPASVKASLSVAMGQRAPNRAGAREDKPLTASAVANKSSRPPIPRSPENRARSHSPAIYSRDRDRGRDDGDRDHRSDRSRLADSDRAAPRDRRRDDYDSRDRRRDEPDRGYDRDRRDRDRDREGSYDRRRESDYDRRDRDRDHDRRRDDYDRGGDRRRDDPRDRDRDRHREADRDRDRRDRRSPDRDRQRGRGSRSRSRSRDRNGSTRDARDVFRDSAREVARDANPDAVRAKYL